MGGEERERGAAALLVVCAMTAVLCMALGLQAIVENGARGSEEFLWETRLRLAAESHVESLARDIERQPESVDSIAMNKWHSYGEMRQEKGIAVSANIKRVVAGGGEDVYLKVWAAPEKSAKWSRGKLVCGWLHREGEQFVWRGWRAVEE